MHGVGHVFCPDSRTGCSCHGTGHRPRQSDVCALRRHLLVLWGRMCQTRDGALPTMCQCVPSVRSRMPQDARDGLNKLQQSQRINHEIPFQNNQIRIFGYWFSERRAAATVCICANVNETRHRSHACRKNRHIIHARRYYGHERNDERQQRQDVEHENDR